MGDTVTLDAVVRAIAEELVAVCGIRLGGEATSAPTEGFVVVVFQVQVSKVNGTVTLCIPASVVETASAQFTQAWPKQRREASAQDRAWITEHIARAGVPVEPMIRATIPASTVLSLEPGSVLALPLGADRPIDLFVGGLRKMTGRLATERGRLMVTVEQRVSETPWPLEKA